jgi:alkylation response protein AidB-like acyl-CoA dehydrogenase
MDFELTDEQKDIQKAAVEFARGEFDSDLALEMDQSGTFPVTIWKKATRLGFIGIHYPEEFGGQGLGLLENILVTEAFCRVDSGIGSALSLVDLGSELILRFGSQDQMNHFLPPLVKGERKLSVAFGESEDDKDLSLMCTTAAKREKGYLIRGVKRFVLNASLADAFIILCKEPAAGWIMLIVEKEDKRIEAHPIEKIGLRMIPSGDLFLQEIWVSQENRLGKEGEGITLLHYFHQRMGLRSLAQVLGIIEGAFDQAVKYSNQREQFGKKLSQFQVVQHKLADMRIGLEVAQWLTYKAAVECEKKEVDPNPLLIAQVEVGRKMARVVDEALQIFGGYGYIAEQEIEHFYRDAWAIRSFLGTEEELKDDIAIRILGTQVRNRSGS